MGQFFIIRTIGSFLLCALSLNIAILLAAPIYWKSQPSYAAETPTARSSAPLPEDSAPATAAIEHASTSEHNENAVNPESSHEESLESFEDHLPFNGGIQSLDKTMGDLGGQAEQTLFTLGSSLGKTTDPITQHISSLAKRLAQHQPETDLEDPSRSGASDSKSQLNPPENLIIKSEFQNRIVIVNASDNRLPVSFLLNGEIQTLAPGDAFTNTEGTVVVRFDRGGQLGTSEQTLGPGRYTFDVSSKWGWQLKAASAL